MSSHRTQAIVAWLATREKVVKRLRIVFRLIAKQNYRHVENLAKPRKFRPKRHKRMAPKKTVAVFAFGLTSEDCVSNPF